MSTPRTGSPRLIGALPWMIEATVRTSPSMKPLNCAPARRQNAEQERPKRREHFGLARRHREHQEPSSCSVTAHLAQSGNCSSTSATSHVPLFGPDAILIKSPPCL